MEQQLGHTLMLLKFRLMNLCVKSEPGALLTVKVPGGGDEDLDIEKVCNVSILDEDSLIIAPFSDSDMNKLRKAIWKEHPEFKQRIETIDLNEAQKQADELKNETTPQEQERMKMPETPIPSVVKNEQADNLLKLLILTVPAVDDDRKKILTDSVDALVDACNLRMTARIDKAKVEIAKFLVGQADDEIKEANDKVEEAAKLYQDAVKESEETKIKEIEEAYKRYLEKHAKEGGFDTSEGGEESAFSMTFDE
ncbi:MAG: hypothetical protein KBT12_02310 [Bacteroidales bacterium]|nr:hypothetical protein [Candidatus Physcousia equi]